MGKPTVYASTLARAAIAIGGETKLATAIDVSLPDLQGWLRGDANPSTAIYHRALDLLIGIGAH